ncbi:MAG: iron-sulfur cluster assembly accessory protein [Candidatus Azotimanducaceae bacterium]|jgi:iron-sulfur cluster assembly accessory protein
MNTPSIKITPTALAHIQKQLTMTEAHFLRLGVKESGCNGYMYMLDYLEQPLDGDLEFEFSEGVKVCVASEDAAMVLGTELDMLTQGLNSALVFKNPNATSYCGCGESFAVGGDPDSNKATDPDGLATDVGSAA